DGPGEPRRPAAVRGRRRRGPGWVNVVRSLRERSSSEPLAERADYIPRNRVKPVSLPADHIRAPALTRNARRRTPPAAADRPTGRGRRCGPATLGVAVDRPRPQSGRSGGRPPTPPGPGPSLGRPAGSGTDAHPAPKARRA